MAEQQKEMEERQKKLDSSLATAPDDSYISGLRTEIANLREQLGRAANATYAAQGRGDPTFHMAAGKGLENGHSANGSVGLASGPKRRMRRLSDPAGHEEDEEVVPYDNDPRAVSMATGQNAYRAPGSTAYIADEDMADPVDQIMFLLENDASLEEDVLFGLVQNLKVPNPSLSSPPYQKEVLFPAHLISLVTNEMWKYGLMNESELFLANVMQTIQQHIIVSSLLRPGFCKSYAHTKVFTRASKATIVSSLASSGCPTCMRCTHSFALLRAIFFKASVQVSKVLVDLSTGTNTSALSPL